MKTNSFNITIVLNVHSEANYLRRTILSLEEATRYAQFHGITVELVVVLDRPTRATKAWIEAYESSVFDGCQVIEVDNGSLGLSRNDGIAVARGEYIATADGDDLVSYNIYKNFFEEASAHKGKAIFIQEYLFGFGDNRDHIWKYYGSKEVSNLALFDRHPYVSRIFARRDLFDQVKYVDVRVTSGFAYEDWHFNCEAVSHGWEFIVAKDTILFYRLRPGSLLQQATNMSTRQVPYSSYFEPDTFLKVCSADYARLRGNSARILAKDVEVRRAFIDSAICEELVLAAHELEPTISPDRIPGLPFSSNLKGGCEAGMRYFELCKQIQGQKFSDILLLPFLKAGGGEKYILATANALSGLDGERSFLVLTGEHCDAHDWLDKLPEKTQFLDLNSYFPGLPDNEIDIATLRIIQATGPTATIHLKPSVYALRFYRKFAKVLGTNKAVFYRFSDPAVNYRGHWVNEGGLFDFLSEFGEYLSIVLYDTDRLRKRDLGKLDWLKDKCFTLPLFTTMVADEESIGFKNSISNKLLWASRLAPEKRPELLIEIARAMERHYPSVVIDVFGFPAFGLFDPAEFSGVSNINYRGGYSSFEMLPHHEYDAFIYTSAYDGMPNVILEALSAGVPVIAPDVGGISEVITPATGFLVDNEAEDTALVQRYLEALSKIYEGAVDLEKIRKEGLKKIEERHSKAAFLRQIASIFKTEYILENRAKEYNVAAE